MSRSTTFQSKISKTKKRLSDDRWAVLAVALSVIGLISILTFGLRTVALTGVYGVVTAEIPVMPASIDDPGYHQFKETPRTAMTRFTPAVVLTTEAFYFGDLAAFTTNFDDVRDKFILRHIDGEPQLQTLVATLDRWIESRAKNENVPIEKVLVLVPTGDIPMPIVIQVIAGLRKSPHVARVVLGSGII